MKALILSLASLLASISAIEAENYCKDVASWADRAQLPA